MDTISRENNSMLPVGGIIVGVIGLLLGGYSAISLSKVNKTLADQQVKIDKVEGEPAAQAAAQAAEKAKTDIASLTRSTQTAFDSVGPALAALREDVTKIQESMKKPAPVAGKKGGGEPAVAGPGEYVVKAQDSGAKIARAHGVTLGDLQTVNPGVDWTKLKPGQKIKLPKK